jgi:four helix bundle protein
MASFQESKAWQHAFLLCKEIYQSTKKFPSHQRFSLSNQMQRAAVSIMSNIAEGWYRGSKNEWRHFLYIAYGSSAELESQLMLANALGYLELTAYEHMIDLIHQIQRLLNYFTKSKQTNS